MFKFNFSFRGFSEQKSRIKAGAFDGKRKLNMERGDSLSKLRYEKIYH